MKLIFTILSLFIIQIGVAQVTYPTNSILTGSKKPLIKYESFYWSSSFNSWELQSEFDYVYNTDYTRIEEIILQPDRKSVFEYNNDQIIRRTEYKFINNVYEPQSKSEYTFGSCVDYPSYLGWFSYSSSSQTWSESSKTDVVFNNDCTIDTMYYTQSFMNTSLGFDVFEYNSNQEVTSKVTFDGQGDTVSVEQYSYSNGEISEHIFLMKNVTSYKMVYHRSNNTQIDSMISYENTNNSTTYYTAPVWELDYRQDYTYNSQGLVSIIEQSSWFGIWQLIYQTDYQYDADGDLITEILQYVSGGNYFNSDKITYTYAFPVSNNNEIVEVVDCKFQNPYRMGGTLSCMGLTENKDYHVVLHDILGREVSRQRITGNQLFSIQENITTGMYILTIQDDEQLLFTKKMIVK